jgi:drug/metabolite transporter (DMT)-like permease
MILLANLCWGAWGIFDKKALSSARPHNVLLVQYLLAVPELILLVGYLLVTAHTVPLNLPACMWAAIASLTATAAMVAYMIAMSRAEASYVLGLTASYPLVMQVLATVFLGEHLVWNRLLGAALIGVGVFAIGRSEKEEHHEGTTSGLPEQARRERLVVTICVIVATIGWGIHGLFDKMAVSYAPPVAVMVARCCMDLITFVAMYFVCGRLKLERRLNNTNTWKFCSCSAACLLVGYIAYLIAMTLTTASYVIVITGCYPLIMYIFALMFLKEKLNLIRLAGVILVVAGGGIVQLTQSA